VQPGTGFDTHGHRDMEIVTCILSGRLRHRDSMGNGEDIHSGEIQLMRAGSGVQHSEFNPSDDEAVHLLQIWIMPDEQGLAPGYWQKTFTDEAKRGRWCLLVSPDAADGSLRIHQDAKLSAARLNGAETLGYPIADGRKAYLHVARGRLQANGHELTAGDGLMFVGEERVSLAAGSDAEVLLFDLA